jgi:hypothetical protein
MEVLAILLSSLIFIASPVGVVLDQVAETAIRDRLAGAETLTVRVDNAPPWQLLQGKVEQLQVAGRGIYPIPELRIAVLDLETDPIDLDIGRLRQGKVALDEPLSGAVHLVITPTDLNQFLQSPAFTERLQQLPINLGTAAQSRDAERYQVSQPQVTVLPNNRLKLAFDLVLANASGPAESLNIEAETGLRIEAGQRLTLLEPALLVNGASAPPQLLDILIGRLGDQLSLQRFEADGVTARVLSWSLQPEALDIALWIKIDPSFTPLGD